MSNIADRIFHTLETGLHTKVANELNSRNLGYKAEAFHSGGGIFCVEIKCPSGLMLCFGDCGETWGADVYLSQSDYEEMSHDDSMWTDLPSGNESPVMIVDAFLKEIVRYEWLHSAETRKRIEQVAEDAELAFWDVVAKAFPEITTGDFPIDITIEMCDHLKNYVALWVRTNQAA